MQQVVHAITARSRRAETVPMDAHAVDAIIEKVCHWARPGDVIAILSNGAFGGIHDKLQRALVEHAGRAQS